MKFKAFLFSFFIALTLNGQSFFYNTQQFGLNSTLLGGAVTAGSSDLSMIYYNPAALRYAPDKGIDFALFIPSYSITNYGDKLGSGKDVNDRNISFNPSLFTYKTSIGKFSFVFTLLQKDLWDNDIRHSILNESTDRVSKKALSYDYEGDEKWFGIGSSFNISDHFSIGISQFWNILNSNYEYGLSSDVQNLVENRLEEFYSDQFHLNVSSIFSMTTKIGVAYTGKNDKLGAVVTTPYYTPYSNSANFEKATSILDFGRTVMTNTIDFDIDPVIKNAWEVDLGYSRILPDSSELWFKVAYHSAVDEYEMFTSDRINLEGLSFVSGLNKVVNLSLGYAKDFNEKFQFLGSVRTNYNAGIQQSNNQRSQSIILLEKDRMHIALGTKIQSRNASFVVGLDYGFSISKESPPFENFPTFNLLDLQETGYSQKSLTLLLTYEFFLDRMGQNISRMLERDKKESTSYPH